MTAPSYLKQRKLGWYVQLPVPRSLQPALGCKVLTRSLKTRDKGEATKLRHAVIVELQGLLDTAGLAPAPATPEGLLKQAQATREAIDRGSMGAHAAAVDFDASLENLLSNASRTHGVDAEGHPRLPAAEVATIRRAHKALAGNLENTLAYRLESYIAEKSGSLNTSTMIAKRRSMEAFAEWFGSDQDCSEVTRKVAGRYVSEEIMRRTQIVTKGATSTATRKKEISDLRAWFHWLLMRGVLDFNPFDQMSSTVRESSRGKEAPRRPWSPEELSTILHGVPPEDPLWSFTALGAYTGMRSAEVGELQVNSVDGNMLKVQGGKSAAAVRRVPIHPALAPLVAQLVATSSDGFLIPGLTRGGPDEKRGWNLGKRFGRVIRKLGIADPLLDYHAFRKTVITAMEEGRVPESTVALVVGHAREGITFGTYSSGVSDQIKREALEVLSYGEKLDSYVKEAGPKVIVRRSSRGA